jgi:4-amino-4-deoxy-L-arabinose transferase-like glycosyltransferase
MPRPAIRLVILLLAALGLYLVGNASVPLLDRDEPRYAQASRQMLQSSDWVVPRFLDDIRAKKPPLIYWLQAGSMRLLGDNAFAARLPSALAVFLSAGLLAVLVWRARGPDHAIWTTLIFCSSALMIVAAKSATTDAVLLLWTVIAQACLYAIWRGNRSWGVAIALAVAIGLGLLTKGLIVGVVLATIAALAAFRWTDRRRSVSPLAPRFAGENPPQSGGLTEGATRLAQALVGLLIVAAMVGPWVFLVHKRSPEFLPAMFHEAAGHALQGREGHGGPPGMHLLFIWADFLPWSLLLPFALVAGWQRRDEPTVRFALAAVIGPWLMVELAIRTKLPEYMLPTIPALAFLTADALLRSLRHRGEELSSRQFVGAAIIWAVVLILISLLPWLAALRFRPLPWVSMSILTLATMIWSLGVVRGLRRRQPAGAVATMGLGMMGIIAILYGIYLPRAQFLRLSILTADVLREQRATGPGQCVMVDYKEPSLAFYQGGTIREHLSEFVISGKTEQWTPWMVITRDVWNRSSPQVQAHLQVIADFRGLSVADSMRDIDLMVVRKR